VISDEKQKTKIKRKPKAPGRKERSKGNVEEGKEERKGRTNKKGRRAAVDE
jgi:hypothetical protein